MRTLSSRSPLPLAMLLAVVVGCAGAEKDLLPSGAPAGTVEPSAAGGGGGADHTRSPGSGGGAGLNDDGSFGLAGAAGADSAVGNGGTPEALGDALENCVGKYQQGAFWPAAGRCSARQAFAPAAGPHKFGALASVLLKSPIAASPVIDAEGSVYVVNAEGLHKFDASLSNQVDLYTGGAVLSAPVITADNEVIALTEAGELIRAGVGETAAKPLTFVREPNEATSGWACSLAVAADGRVIFASPKGTVYVVNPKDETTDSQPLGEGVTLSGSAVTISTQGDLAIGTDKGLFVLPNGRFSSPLLLKSAPVSRTPVFIPTSGKAVITAIYADDNGIVHNVVVDDKGTAVDRPPPKGALPLGLLPGAPAVSPVGGVAKVFIGDGAILKLLDTTEGTAVVDSQTEALVAAGPIVAAPATDSEGQLFVPSTDGSIYLLTKNPGQTLSFVVADSFLTQGAITTAPALAGNRLYFGSSDKVLYMITEAPSPGDIPAPGDLPTPGDTPGQGGK